MIRFIALFLLLSTSALAQSVQQTGTVTPGHPAMWAANGVVKDAGTAANGFLTSLGVQNNGGPGVCVNSGPITGPYNQLCMSASASSNALITLQNYNGATPQSISLLVNGVTVPFGNAPGGTNGQIQFNNAGSLGGYNRSGVGTIIASVAGTLTPNDCVKIGANGDLIDNGSVCGAGPAGSSGQIQFNSSGALGASANLTWSSPTLTLGNAGATAGALAFANATSGSITLQPTTGALGSSVLTLPAATDTLAGKALANGGTNAALTASNGGIIYSTASAFAVLPGTVTAGQCLLSGSSAAPAWGSCSGAAAVSSVAANDSTLTISPTTGAVLAALNLTNPNTWTGAQTFSGDTTQSGSAFIISGNISKSAWTTSGIRIKGVTGTLTDTTSSGTVATAYTDVLGGNTIAASNSTTFTNYETMHLKDPVAGSNATLTNKWAFGADSLRVGTSNQLTVTNAGLVTIPGTLNITGTFSNIAVNTDIWAATAGKVLDAGNVFNSAGALVSLGGTAAAPTVDLNTGFNFSFNVTSGTAFTLQNPTNTKVGQTGCIFIRQPQNNTVAAISYQGNWKFSGGASAAPALTAPSASYDVVDMLCYIVRTSTFIVGTMTKDAR